MERERETSLELLGETLHLVGRAQRELHQCMALTTARARLGSGNKNRAVKTNNIGRVYF